MSDSNPSLSGNPVTFTATVAVTAPASGTPTGNVTFMDGATSLGNGILNASLQATLTTSALSAGTHSITAVYAGDANFSGSTSPAITQTVNQAPAITSANSTIFMPGVAGSFTVTTTGFPTGAAMAINETGALPAGITFTNNNDGTATLAGTTSAGGDFPITIKANNGIAPNATQAFIIHVQAPPAITSANKVTFVAGTAATNFTVTTTGFPTGASMLITETGALPSGVTFTNNNDGTATITNTAAAGTGGTYPITITANNGIAPNATQAFTITVNEAPAITSANNTTFVAGSAGNFSVTTTGFPTGASMAISEAGALPTGVTFVNNNNGTASLAGTPAAGTGGSYPITITADNGVAPSATQSFTLTVQQAPTITSANSTTFTVGTAGTFSVTATGVPGGASIALSEAGALPGGVAFVDNGNGTATLAGAPDAGSGGSYALTITANNGVAPNATQAFTLNVNEAPAITSANNTTFKVGTAGTFTVTTSGFPTNASMLIAETGALPGGVTFTNNNNGTATLAGTPTANGVFALTITANNGVGTPASQSFTLTVNESPTITSANSATFQVGVASTFTVTTTGFPTNASMAIIESGALPGGVTFVNNNNGTATLSGTPAAASGGSYALTITANNGVVPNATQAFTLTVQQAPAITSANTTTFMPGVAGSFTVTTSGFPTNASMVISETGTLPGGVTFVNNNDGTATLAGTPAALTQNASPYGLTITANNGVAPNATQAFTLNVVCPVITVNGSIADQLYNTPMTPTTFTQSGGNGAISWTASGLAPGESIGGGTGTVAGTPGNTGTFVATVTATDAFGCSGSSMVTYNVDPNVADDSYTALGNVLVDSSTGSPSAFAVTDNDSFPAGTTISAFDATSIGGGKVSMTTSGGTIGQFTYDPPTGGMAGTDTFTYTVTSNGRTATGTVTFTLNGRVWFIDNSAGACSAGCDGRESHPFTNTSAFQTANDGGAGHPGAGDPIFIHAGGAAYSGAIVLLDNQRLIGEGAAGTLATLGVLTVQNGQSLPATGGTAPTLTSAGVVVTTGTGNFIHGVTLGNGTTALSGTNFGTLTANDNVTINTNGRALVLTTGNLSATFAGISSSGGVNNVLLTGVTTTGTANLGGGSLSGATGDAFTISGQNGSFSYSGSITDNSAFAVNIGSKNGGTVALSGAISSSGAAAKGVSLTGNTGATNSFTGTLTLSTAANNAFTASGGGTVTATDANSTITTTTGTALNVTNTTIGASGLKFKSISAGTGASGPASGIVLTNTGASGGLTVTGTGAAGQRWHDPAYLGVRHRAGLDAECLADVDEHPGHRAQWHQRHRRDEFQFRQRRGESIGIAKRRRQYRLQYDQFRRRANAERQQHQRHAGDYRQHADERFFGGPGYPERQRHGDECEYLEQYSERYGSGHGRHQYRRHRHCDVVVRV